MLKQSKGKTIVALAGIVITAALVAFLGYFLIFRALGAGTTPEEFRDYIQSFGMRGGLVALLIQVLQVFIALIPGEVVEIGCGYAFGPWMGTFVCYAGIILASTAVFFLVRRFGIRLVNWFVDLEQVHSLRFLQNEQKRNKLVFLLFFIPGTPKDLLTYVVPLTPMKYSTFMVLTLIARLPSLISSTFGGHFIASGQYWEAVLLFVITGAVSLAGIGIYRRIIARHSAS